MYNNILNIVINSNINNLNKVLNNIDTIEQKKQIQILFEEHMKEITNYCLDNFINKEKLSETFIMWLHKIHYPKWYIESNKTIKGDAEIITMIPGNYKTLQNFDWVDPKDVKSEMNKLINLYNENIKISNDKKKLIIYILINLYRIHPFWNWNGRVISIIIDLMLIKNNINPIYFNKLLNTNRKLFSSNIVQSIKSKSITNINKIIKETIL